jgi:hypothetical protein
MTHLRLHETPKLGVHQTGSSSKLLTLKDAADYIMKLPKSYR